jgi:hypothetical protein
MEAVHRTHSIIFVVGLILLLMGFHRSDALEWTGIILLAVWFGVNFLASVTSITAIF